MTAYLKKIACLTLALVDRAEGGHYFDTLDALEDGGGVLVVPLELSRRHFKIFALPFD